MNTRFLIVVSGWNCARWVRLCLDSIKAQTYINYSVVIVDDASTDGTFKQIKINRGNFHAYKLSKNRGIVYAREYGTYRMKDYDVIAWLDLDDELLPSALEVVAKAYQDKNVWLTYGNYKDIHGQVFFSNDNIEFTSEDYRSSAWKFIPFRTFRKELFFKLTQKDLYPEKATIYPDANMLYCMLEMAGMEHTRAIPEVIYKYRNNNPLCVTKRFKEKERDDELNFVKSLPRKEKLQSL